MSHAGEINTAAGPVPPSVATQYDTNDGNYAVPASRVLKVYGNNTATPAANGFQSYTTSLGLGTDNTVWVNSHGTAKWVVNPIAGVGTHTTITAAIASATSGDIIFITEGTYPESFTLPAGIDLTALVADDIQPNVVIQGKITCNDSGSRTISNIELLTNNDYFLVMSGGNATKVNIVSCYLNCTNHTGINIITTGSSRLGIQYCSGNISLSGITLFSFTGTAYLAIYYCIFYNSGLATTASSSTGGGTLDFEFCYFAFPISLSTGSTFISARNSAFDCNAVNSIALTVNSVNESNCYRCDFTSGTAPSVTIGTTATLMMNQCSATSSNTNAITGLGAVIYNQIGFLSTSSTINTTTQTPNIVSNDAIKVISASGASYTTKSQDQLILVDGNVTATIVPLASPTTGQKHIIKDNAGTAAAHNITVTPSGKNIDGAASSVINQNYASITIVYNGTQWNIV